MLLKNNSQMEVSLENNHSVIIESKEAAPQWKPFKVPELKQNQVLIQIEASTINPTDILGVTGAFRPYESYPMLNGKEGVGKVVKLGNQKIELLGKRVCFVNGRGGGWSHYAVAVADVCIAIDDDVPVSSAASGVVNPLTVLGFIDETRRRKQKSIVHTAAASALGRMLNKICQKEGITLLNIVRKQQQADLLRSQGAEHIIVTTGDWETQYVQKIKELDSKILFDALGGGEVQTKLIQHHPTDGVIYVYGVLQDQTKPENQTTIPFAKLIEGLEVTGFFLPGWLARVNPEHIKAIREKYSSYLKNELSSTFLKEFKMEEIKQALEYYQENSSKGKILLRP